MSAPQPEPKVAERSEDDINLEQAVTDVIMGGRRTFPVVITLNKGKPAERELMLNFRWPDLDDQAEIDARASLYSPGVPLKSLTDFAQNIAYARATIETLTENPYPEWLPCYEEPINHKGRMQMRPNTGRVKSITSVLALYTRYMEIYSRFQDLAI